MVRQTRLLNSVQVFVPTTLVIAREIGNRRGEVAPLGNLGLAYTALAQVEKAIGLLEQAHRIGQEIKDPRIIRFTTAALKRLRSGCSET